MPGIDNVNSQLDKKINKILNRYKSETDQDQSIVTNLVLSGGGVKGIAHIGALKLLEEEKILKNIKVFAGTSIGGIIAGMYCIGYSPDDLYNFIEMFDLTKLMSFSPSDFLQNYALDNGHRITFVMGKMFESKNVSKNITFKELYNLSKIKLIVSTVCLNDNQVYYISHITHPGMQVITGLRMTSAFPLIFTPVSYNGKLYVDGCCIDNYPIRLFKDELKFTVGVYVRAEQQFKKSIDNLEDFLFALLDAIIEGMTSNSINAFESNTVVINTPDIKMTESVISNNAKKDMYARGYESTKNFLKLKNKKIN